MHKGAAAAAAVLALTLAGCGGGGTDSVGGEPDAGGSSGATSGSPSPSATVPDPTPTVEPATGPQLDVEGIKVNAPATWKQTYDTFAVDVAQNGDAGSLMLSVAATSGDVLSLAQAEKYFWEGKKAPAGYRSLETTTLGGLTAYHNRVANKYEINHSVGLWDSGYVVKVELGMPRRVPEKKMLELLDSIIATYESPRTAG
jgi:hypothetical protein